MADEQQAQVAPPAAQVPPAPASNTWQMETFLKEPEGMLVDQHTCVSGPLAGTVRFIGRGAIQAMGINFSYPIPEAKTLDEAFSMSPALAKKRGEEIVTQVRQQEMAKAAHEPPPIFFPGEPGGNGRRPKGGRIIT